MNWNTLLEGPLSDSGLGNVQICRPDVVGLHQTLTRRTSIHVLPTILTVIKPGPARVDFQDRGLLCMASI
jgi:hypothetical protein